MTKDMEPPTTTIEHAPFIPAHASLPEITLKAIILSIILTTVLGAANAYLGLRVGLTISASIPAAVISMGVLRLFKHSNVLENNIVQTAASSGEALTAGIIFTIPALIVIRFWTHFNYIPMVIIGIIGGILGVLFSIPLRQVLLADPALRFPEGVAIGNILKASSTEENSLKYLVLSGGLGAIISICQTGFKLLADNILLWIKIGPTIIGSGIGFNPALIGAGYIIGADVAVSIFCGVFVGWILGIPILAWQHAIPASMTASHAAMEIWSDSIRYIGLGVMAVGGIWAISALLKPMFRGIVLSIKTMGQAGLTTFQKTSRTEQDIPMLYVIWGILLMLLPIYFILQMIGSHSSLPFSAHLLHTFSLVNLFFVIICGFIIASVCAYFAGLVGSSTNPLSSLALISLILASGVVLFLLGKHFHFDTSKAQAMEGAGIAILMTALIACTAAISNDTIQDLKAGHMVGATPWKQQVMLIVGVVVAAFVIPGILQLLFNAYGLAGVFPHPGMDPSQMLLAPQASLMAAVAEGMFTHHLAWSMILIGSIIAIASLIIDKWLRRYGKRFPVLAVGLGIYLPVDTSTPLVLGGIISYLVHRQLNKKLSQETITPSRHRRQMQVGILLASGLVAGAALTGVLLAIPFVIEGSGNALRILPESTKILPEILGTLVTIGLCIWFYRKIVDNA